MTKSELIKHLMELPVPDNTRVYFEYKVWGEVEDGEQLLTILDEPIISVHHDEDGIILSNMERRIEVCPPPA